jgi:hypothetical protein
MAQPALISLLNNNYLKSRVWGIPFPFLSSALFSFFLKQFIFYGRPD